METTSDLDRVLRHGEIAPNREGLAGKTLNRDLCSNYTPTGPARPGPKIKNSIQSIGIEQILNRADLSGVLLQTRWYNHFFPTAI